MSYHYFETEPILEKVEFDDSFLILVNPAPKKPNAKSKEDKEHNARVQTQTDGLRKSLALIATGHVDLNNRPIEFDNIFHTFDWWENFDNLHVYYCKPTSAKKPWSRYSSYDEKTQIYEFDVVRTFASRDELVKFLLENYKYSWLIAKIISSYSYGNDGYGEKFKSYVEYIFGLVPGFGGDNTRWDNELYWVAKKIESNGRNSDSNLLWAIQNGYVTVDPGYTSDDTISELCKKKLYMSLLEYTKRLISAQSEKLSYTTKLYLTEASSSPTVKEAIKLLGIETPRLVLVVVETGGYGSDKELERVEFKTMDEVKTYIIKNYDISFAELEGGVDRVNVRINEDRRIEFRATVTGV